MPFRDSPGNPAFIITGSGRSGTTWLAEILAAHLHGRIIFEPFRPGIVPSLAGLNNRQYLRPGDPAPEFFSGIETILRGNIRNAWTDRYNDRFRYSTRVIKAIRANLMVGWMLEAFPDTRILHVVRDPFPTMSSQKKGGWKLDISKFTTQTDLMTDYLHPFRPLIDEADTADKLAALHWAIENYVPVSQAHSGEWPSNRITVMSYDALRQSRATMTQGYRF